MTDPAQAHIEGQRRIRDLTTQRLAQVWTSMQSHNEEDVPQWLAVAVPLVLAAQHASVSLTDAYLGHAMGRQPFGIPPAGLVGAAVRNGTSPEIVYRRPFVTVWSELAAGKALADAVVAGLERALSTAEMDVQMSMRAAATAVDAADPRMRGFHRVADPGACEFCLLVDGAYVKSGAAMPLHNRCGCGLKPNTDPEAGSTSLPDGVAVREHGELGPLLVDPAHHFTTEHELH